MIHHSAAAGQWWWFGWCLEVGCYSLVLRRPYKSFISSYYACVDCSLYDQSLIFSLIALRLGLKCLSGNSNLKKMYTFLQALLQCL